MWDVLFKDCFSKKSVVVLIYFFNETHADPIVIISLVTIIILNKPVVIISL